MTNQTTCNARVISVRTSKLPIFPRLQLYRNQRESMRQSRSKIECFLGRDEGERDSWHAEKRNNSMRLRCIHEWLLAGVPREMKREIERESVCVCVCRDERRVWRSGDGLVHHPRHDRCQWDLGYQVMLLGICISWTRRMHERGEEALSSMSRLARRERWEIRLRCIYKRVRRGRSQWAYRVLSN